MAIILEQNSKNKKKALWVSAVILVLIVIAAGAWYAFSAFDISFLSFNMLKEEKQLPEDMLEPYVNNNFLARLDVNEGLLQDIKLKSLQQFIVLPIKIGAIGRQNPFVSP